jgi:hypothetical protein
MIQVLRDRLRFAGSEILRFSFELLGTVVRHYEQYLQV